MNLIIAAVLFTFPLTNGKSDELETCSLENLENSCSETIIPHSKYRRKRYLLYDVNPGEGFNLRRDVYMRMATLVKKLNEENNDEWTLVLPPWGPLYHWKSENIGYQAQIKWSQFFHIPSLQLYVPVMEFEDFLDEHGRVIDALYYLQNYAEGWKDGVWEERVDIKDCIDEPPYRVGKNGKTTGWFWGYEDVFVKKFSCLSIQGYSSTLKNYLKSSTLNTVMIDRAEVVLHDVFGDKEYWMVRRSMSFSKKLIHIGNEFREKHFQSTDKEDKTEKSCLNLTLPIKRKALGGPYIGVHLRRQDFIRARPKEVPSVKFAAQQIKKQMKRLSLEKVFIATDAIESEFKELLNYIPGAVRFQPTKAMAKDLMDGGIAIVDQWISAHSRFFIGTFESTFSFRIQEEREIIGFPVESTFNRLCGDNQTTCVQPSKWMIAF